jgi:hypothetical protein
MRLGWRVGLPGPFYLAGTIWRSKPRRSRRHAYAGQLPGWRCEHDHRTEGAALECARRETRRRRRP